MSNSDLVDEGGEVRLRGSRDSATGQIYFPFRALAADGSLRPCEPVALTREGLLFSWTRMGKHCFGQVDLPEGVRVQTPLGDGDHQTGTRYGLDVATGEDGQTNWRFIREQ